MMTLLSGASNKPAYKQNSNLKTCKVEMYTLKGDTNTMTSLRLLLYALSTILVVIPGSPGLESSVLESTCQVCSIYWQVSMRWNEQCS